MSEPHDVDPLPADASWPERVEHEVNRQLGGDASIDDLVELMIGMGWRPPEASRAVNAHEELVAALRRLLTRIDNHFGTNGDPSYDWQEQEEARRVLAKARGDRP